MIDWKEVARRNGLTPDEFAKEVFTCAACLGAEKLDQHAQTEFNTIKFTCSDDVGKIEVLIRRVTPIGGE